MLRLLLSVAENLPNLDSIVSTRGQRLSEKFGVVIVECLTSSKSETRSTATSLLEACVENNVLGLDSIRRATEKLKPAKQRSVAPLIASIAKRVGPQTEKENLPSTKPPPGGLPPTSPKPKGKPSPSKHAPKSPGPRQKNQLDVDAQAPSPEKSRHPLVPRSGKRLSGQEKKLPWPSFPEEPNGALLGNLKRFWASYLPPSTVTALFPSSGIKKQDDARAGCETLLSALSMDRSSGKTTIVEHLDPILKWLMYALCSKETTTGLQDVLTAIKDVLVFLQEGNRQLSDSEALETVPFLLEKTSNAKVSRNHESVVARYVLPFSDSFFLLQGRFRDSYAEILSALESDVLLPAKRLSSVVCVAVMEGSSHVKARALACQMCLSSVETLGLAGIGKRGVLSAAKLLSQETAKNRAAALDLMELILSKMNGDIQRLVRICGPNLTEKARQLLEERKNKSNDSEIQSAGAGSPERQSRGTSPRKAPPSSSRTSSKKGPELYTELPKLSLRSGAREHVKPSPRRQARDQEPYDNDDPFSFSARASTRAPTDGGKQSSFLSLSSRPEPSSAAASLRARLLKIREKEAAPGSEGIDAEPTPEAVAAPSVVETDELATDALERHMDTMKSLLENAGPVFDDDPDLELCVQSLRVFHAALARQQHAAVGLTAAQLDSFRLLLVDDIDAAVEMVRR